MAVEVVMPSLGMYTTEGRIARWEAEPGSLVKEGQVIVSVETEKAVFEVEAPRGGIWHPTAKLGSTLPDQAIIGYILEPGESVPGGGQGTKPEAGAAHVERAGAVAAQQSPTEPGGGPIKASPAARKLARDLNVDITTVTGTGPGGRITERDVQAAASES
jgi:pyruvate dehydrogenase E2 component (dihydrolipoamide acetyltransferase)